MTKNYQTIFYLSSFYINMQKIMLNNHVAFEISWFKASQNLIDCKFFLNMPNLKFTNLLLRFLNLYLHVKNIVDSDFRDVCFKNSAIWLTQSLFDLTELKFSYQLSSPFSLSQHAKNHADWASCSSNIAALRSQKLEILK